MARRRAAPKRPTPYRSRRYGILNPYGDIWSPVTFATIEEAKSRIADFWSFDPRHDLSQFSVVPVRVTVSAIG